MGRLVFIGAGLMGGRWLTLKGLQRAKEVDHLFGEFYTSYLGMSGIEDLKREIGREIVLLTREELEMGEKVFDALEEGDVGLIVGGDPMAATTHVELRLEAERRGHETEIVYGVSILVAAPSAMGLQHYKFGRVVSVPWVSESFAPKSVLDVIDGNLKEGLHTLLLLDLKEDGGFMTVSESLKTLKYLEERHRKGVIDDNTLVVGGARIGDRTEYIKGGRLRDLLEVDFGPPVHVVVIPGRLHFVEEEALMKIASVKEEEISHWRKRIDEKYKGLIPS